MIIKSLKLENIRSHHRSDIKFAEGFNCVSGGVGVGKTSILYAIHFALFGEPLYRSYDYLLREGASIGKVLLTLEHNGHEYTVTRQLRREKNRITQSMDELYLYQDGKAVAWGKVVAVQEQLKALTGLDRRIFEEFIWIQQERLKTLLYLRPAERQSLLDAVFGLSDFQEGWEKLQQFQRDYQSTKSTLEKDPDLVSLPQLSADLQELERSILNETVEVENLKVELEAAEKKLQQLTAHVQTAEQQREKANQLQIELAALQSRRVELTRHVEQLTKLNDQAKEEEATAVKKLQQLENSAGQILQTVAQTGYPPTRDTESLQTILRELNSETLRLQSEITELKVQSRNNMDSLQILKTRNICPTCRRPMDDEYRQTFARRMEDDHEQCENEIHKLTSQAEALQKKHTAITNALSQLESITREKENIERMITDTRERSAKVTSEIQVLQDTRDHYVSPRIREIECEVSRFDVEELEKSRRLKEEAVKTFERTKVTLASKTELLQRTQVTRNLLLNRITNAEEKMAEKRGVEKILSIVSLFRAAYKAVIPPLRTSYITTLRVYVQSALDSLIALSGRSYYIDIDEEYTPLVREESTEARDVNQISGGERTWIALAYRIGLGQLVTEARTGQSPESLIMDEPTEALGSEDKSIEALALAVSNLKAARQIIVVTHSEELADKASHKISLTKQAGRTTIQLA